MLLRLTLTAALLVVGANADAQTLSGTIAG